MFFSCFTHLRTACMEWKQQGLDLQTRLSVWFDNASWASEFLSFLWSSTENPTRGEMMARFVCHLVFAFSSCSLVFLQWTDLVHSFVIEPWLRNVEMKCKPFSLCDLSGITFWARQLGYPNASCMQEMQKYFYPLFWGVCFFPLWISVWIYCV